MKDFLLAPFHLFMFVVGIAMFVLIGSLFFAYNAVASFLDWVGESK